MCTAPTPTIASHTTPPDRSMSSCSNAHSSCPEAPTQRLGKERDEAEGQHNLCSPEAPREPLFSIRSVISLAITQLSQSQIRATRTLLSWSRLSPLGAPRASRPNAIPNPEKRTGLRPPRSPKYKSTNLIPTKETDKRPQNPTKAVRSTSNQLGPNKYRQKGAPHVPRRRPVTGSYGPNPRRSYHTTLKQAVRESPR